MSYIFDDIRQERISQDHKWGGQAHDDAHTAAEWVGFITAKLGETVKASFYHGTVFRGDTLPLYRRGLVQVAALAVAAIEAYDREHK